MISEHTRGNLPYNGRLAPGEVMLASQWTEWLVDNLYYFEGDFGKAGTLMAAFTEGVEFVAKSFWRRKLRLMRPPIGIHLKNSNEDFAIMGCESQKGEYLYVSERYLEQASLHDMEETYSISRNETPLDIATLPNFFRIGGVEEMHHSAFIQCKGPVEPLDPKSSAVWIYDASEVEYKALLWKLRFSKQRDLDPRTISVLSARQSWASLRRLLDRELKKYDSRN